jgi:hypothetical protein
MRKDDLIRVQHMLDAAERSLEYVSQDFGSFGNCAWYNFYLKYGR